jgi:hypothetical protein
MEKEKFTPCWCYHQHAAELTLCCYLQHTSDYTPSWFYHQHATDFTPGCYHQHTSDFHLLHVGVITNMQLNLLYVVITSIHPISTQSMAILIYLFIKFALSKTVTEHVKMINTIGIKKCRRIIVILRNSC